MRSVLIEHVEKVMVVGRCPRGRPAVMFAQGEVLHHAHTMVRGRDRQARPTARVHRSNPVPPSA